jgi:serine/threonine-protein kinase
VTRPADAPDDALLAEFLRQVEEADDPDAVLRNWRSRHPRLADDLTALLYTARLLRTARDPAEPRPPERLGDFRVVRRIASGGMGVIYEAVQDPFGRRVAVKTMRSASVSEQSGERFLREQAVLARLHHTSVVPIFAAGRAGDTHYFAMPYIDGVSLRDTVRGLRGAANESESRWQSAAAQVADAAEAVAHAHDRGVLHRDLKPANLMLDRDGRVWVLDFGLAGLRGDAPAAAPADDVTSGDLSIIGSVMGTIDYMAPEQLRGRADERSDVWGLGAVLYELLTLRRPFAADALPQPEPALMRRLRELERPPVPPRAVVPRLPRDLEAVCLKCLEREPAARYPSARAVADDLRRYLRGDETSVRPWGSAERVGRWARRQPAHAGLTAAAAVVLLLLALVAGHVGELRAANARAADKLARLVDRQLQLVAEAVREEAARPELREGLANHQAGEPGPLQHLLRRTEEETHRRKFARPGDQQPFVNWFVMDPEGHILADSYADPPNSVLGQWFGYRDYARPLLGPDALPDPHAVHVSRVFPSRQDFKSKFAVATRVRDRDSRPLGLVAATVAIDSRMVAVDMRDEPPGAFVVGPTDRNPRPGAEEETARLPRYVVVLGAGYGEPGANAQSADDRADLLRAFEEDGTRRRASETFLRGGRLWFADCARVGDSHFVAVVEQPYPWEVNLIGWAGLAAAAVAVALAARWAVARRRLAV